MVSTGTPKTLIGKSKHLNYGNELTQSQGKSEPGYRTDSRQKARVDHAHCSSFCYRLKDKAKMSSSHSGVLLSIFCLCAISCTEVFGHTSVISVRNGGQWGDWQNPDRCPDGWIAYGFALKVQGSQVKGDNTALNGIRLFCKESAQASIVRSIESGTGQWGSWTSTQWCSEGFLKAFLLQVETHQKGGDDTAANDIIFICSNGTVLAGHGQAWGNWGSQSNACERGISSIRTKVEQPTGDGDETALNDVRFFCH
ncbi:vitelline membrane outer layer protein 1-like [Polypterus senegalus]|uniref:vitelline membrane outer layer protein 1-like n=1 Tax=Polypterus senegalus TaxID=55291 RepID=UPI001963EF8F|nr:vitelline membrane outer layer protein 1-like [Polypterus senegalus]